LSTEAVVVSGDAMAVAGDVDADGKLVVLLVALEVLGQ
jgi:hypothetical protein